MSGVVTFVGEISIAGLCPSVVGGIGVSLAQLQAKLAGLTKLAASFAVTPPQLSTNLQNAIQTVTALTIAIGLSLPGVDFQIQAVAGQLAAIEAQLQLLLQLKAVLGAEAFVFTYAGDAAGMGAAVTQAIGGGWPDGSSALAPANALILGTVGPAAWGALTAFFAIP